MDSYSSYQSSGGTGSQSKLQKLSYNIGSNIQKISQNVKSLQQLMNQLGTDQDSPQLRSQLHQVQHYTGGLAKDTNAEIRNFQTATVPPGEDARAWRMQVERLMREFTQALHDFQEAQRLVAAKEKDALKKAKADSDSHYFDEHGRSNLLDFGGSGSSAPVSQMQLQMEQEAELQALQERESQIRQLESDITDVNQIFKDLATMVHEQGEMIDSIEANVESAQVHVTQASGEISQARQYQTKARKKKLCIFIIILLIVAIIIGIIVWSSSD